MPRWLRWAFCVPLGVLCSWLVVGLLEAVFDAAGLPRVHAFTLRAAASRFVGAFTFTWFPAMLSPKPWPVGIVMFAVDLLLAVGPLAWALRFPYMRERMLATGWGTALGAIGLGALGACLALSLLWRRGRSAPV